MKARRRLKLAFQIIIAVLCVICLAFCVYVLVERYALKNDMPSFFGYSFAIVGSGSMEPAIETGDLIVVKSCDSYELGDVITFWDEGFGGYITHRVVEVSSDGSFTTRGDREGQDTDANPVSIENIVGKVVRVSSAGGAVLRFLQDPVCLVCVIGMAVGLWIIVDLSFWIARITKESRAAKRIEAAEEEDWTEGGFEDDVDEIFVDESSGEPSDEDSD